nr:uncharacterized protein LOC101738759 isoform X2 [Bombyx mori]
MSSSPSEEPLSDDEIFFGKLSLKEFKKHILWNKNSPVKLLQFSNVHNSKGNCNKSLSHDEKIADKYNEKDKSTIIIESHSEPDLRPNKSNVTATPTQNRITETDDSFLHLEDMVEKLCVSLKSESADLNNTLDVIDFILKNGPNKETEISKIIAPEQVKSEIKTPKNDDYLTKPMLNTKNSPEKKDKECQNKKIIAPEEVKAEIQTPKTDDYLTESMLNTKNYPEKKYKECPNKQIKEVNPLTPFKKATKVLSQDTIQTPLCAAKSKDVFKTPAPLSQKKVFTTLHKSPARVHAYQHIGSPVASYIKNGPQAPLLKDVHPKKPLPGTSSIPKASKDLVNKVMNKENINLPSVAYKNAIKTKIINTPRQVKLPLSHWNKKNTSLPRPVVMKHEHREVDLIKTSQPEESFAGLPYHQAEVSVCTKKSAFQIDK